MCAVIITKDLGKDFNGIRALSSISIQVSKGEIFGLLGPNGAGKTTLLRILTGMISPSSGHAEVLGIPVNKFSPELYEQIGFLPETSGFYDQLSAWRNLEYFAEFYNKIRTKEQVEKYLKLMDLWERRDDKVKKFSKGMKQRLAIARALIHEPQIILLDEPTSGLDPESASFVRDVIKKFKSQGRTILLSTHNLLEAETLCDRIAIIKTRVIAEGNPQELKRLTFGRELMIEVEPINTEMIEKIKKLEFVDSVALDRNRLTLRLRDIEEERSKLVKLIVDSGAMILSIHEKDHPLEEVYIDLIRMSTC